MNSDDQQQSRLLYELCSLVFSLVRSPHFFLPISPPSPRLGGEAPIFRTPRWGQVSLGEIASLLLGVSFTLLLCGSVTFMLGCILMPWVVGFVMLFYFMGIVSSLSGIGKAILSLAVPATTRSSPKEASGIL
ncbi:hypothetical protein HPP92_025259 [Vanilla planifolia]|uniref:Transmembrane protein n=1 Tax=Vanilla planifolia TaxID=51239 RepID=A0A835PHN4_VANPL|nr:hypothetical protein HPP92_025259 [Vanilla planifolia]